MKVAACCEARGRGATQGNLQQKALAIEKVSISIDAKNALTSPIVMSNYPNDEPPSCWICMDEGPDDRGHPLRRDCSCRGSSAGFGHPSCVTQYAEQKFTIGPSCETWDPFIRCPNCNQNYQNELALDMADALVTFIQEKFPTDRGGGLHQDQLHGGPHK